MLDRNLRPLKTSALTPVAAWLAPVPAVAITGFGLAVGLGAAALAAVGWWLPALVAWLTNRVLDGLDGEVARTTATASDRGGYLDLVADSIVYAALPLGVAAGVGTTGAWVAAAFLLGSFYVNIVTVTLLAAIREKRSAGSAAVGQQTSVPLPDGLIEGAETIVLLAVILAVPTLAVWSMTAMAAAVTLTAACRVGAAWASIGPDPADRRTGPTRTGPSA